MPPIKLFLKICKKNTKITWIKNSKNTFSKLMFKFIYYRKHYKYKLKYCKYYKHYKISNVNKKIVGGAKI